jgi:hypothetical protein
MCTGIEHNVSRQGVPYDFMEFRLIYKGALPSAANDTRVRYKNQIREYLHPQLEQLWTTHPALQWIENIEDSNSLKIPLWQAQDVRPKITKRLDDREFIPMVAKDLDLYCKLRILFLRPERAGWVIRDSGDLDNRMKVLFDALRIPRSAEEARGLSQAVNPFFCLLENDDSLISGIEVDTDQLLTSPNQGSSYAELIIQVSIKVTHLTWTSMAFAGD